MWLKPPVVPPLISQSVLSVGQGARSAVQVRQTDGRCSVLGRPIEGMRREGWKINGGISHGSKVLVKCFSK